MGKIQKFTLLLLLFSGVFFIPQRALADQVNLPSDLNVDGLTPDSPFAIMGDPPPAAALINSMEFHPPVILTLNEYDSDPLPQPEQAKIASVVEVKATPTPSSIPTPSPTPAASPSPTPQTTSGGLNADTLFNMVNSHRQSMGLASFQKNDMVCQLASERAPMVDHEIATGTMHAGLKNFDFPYWNTENIISMNTEQGAFNWWINDTIHREAIEGDYKYSCLSCSGYACAEEFTNLVPK